MRSSAYFASLHLQLEPRYRLADQVPDREQALDASGRIDTKLTGANPFHVMIRWHNGASLYDPATLNVIKETHEALEKAAGLGNVWSLESLRRWLRENGDDNIETVKKYVKLLPENLVRRFIAKEQDAVLVTGRLPDIDASQILPVVEKVDHALDPVRKAYPNYEISVTGLPALAARNSYRMISQLDESIPLCVLVAAILLAVAFRSVFVGFISILPGLFPVVTSGALLWYLGDGLEFASVVALLVVFGLGVDALIHFLNRLRLEEQPGVSARTCHPPGPRACRTRDHLDDDGACLRSRRDDLLGVAVAQDIWHGLRRDAARVADRRSRFSAGNHPCLSTLYQPPHLTCRHCGTERGRASLAAE